MDIKTRKLNICIKMKNFIYKSVISVFSLAFAALVLTTFIADRLSAMSFRPVIISPSLEERLGMIELAIKLDPLDAELRFKRFVILQEIRVKERRRRPGPAELNALKEAIELRPLWPKYHLYYGLVLERMTPRPNVITRERILSQLKKAADLKPYSELYQKKYRAYLEKHEKQ